MKSTFSRPFSIAATLLTGLLSTVACSAEPLVLQAREFRISQENYYRDRSDWLAIDPKKHQEAEATIASPFPSGKYDVTIRAVGENDGASTYWFSINDSEAGTFQCPVSRQRYEEGAAFSKTWKGIEVSSGDVLEVRSRIGSSGEGGSSRARWSRLEFLPADEKTKAAVAKLVQDAKPATKVWEDTGEPLVQPRKADGAGEVTVEGDLRQWHKVTLSLDGPFAHECDNEPNPFTDYRFEVVFTHESGEPRHVVPGYFAADGNAADSSAESGTVWRAHLAPDKPGNWQYEVSFRKGKHAAVLELDESGTGLAAFHGLKGGFEVAATDKTAPDFRAKGRLDYVGKRYLRFAGSGEYFLKAGPDAPETLLAFRDFDNTVKRKEKGPLKSWKSHLQDWEPGDPTWKNGKGKGLIGALNYLSGKGVNSFSFLPYNAGGDGDNVWPFVAREAKLHYDCSKLDQWGIVFDHATAKGLYLHFKLQENEMDDDRRGHGKKGKVPESLDGGQLGVERKLYCRELIARFAHNLALNWNIGEENTQSAEEIRDMVRYLKETDPYDHNVVIHTFPSQQDKVYPPLLGEKGSLLTGASLQNPWNAVHQRTLKWIRESEKAGRPWVVANDEQNPASHGVPPDPGYRGHSGKAEMKGQVYTLDDIRKYTLWGNLMAGGAGVEYYFGYKLPENDLVCEDFRSRDKTWDYCRIALDFLRDHEVPFWEMSSANPLAGNTEDDNSRYCFAKNGEIYLIYLPEGGSCDLNLRGVKDDFSVQWFDPRKGGELAKGSIAEISGGRKRSLGVPPGSPKEDWLVVIKRK